MKKLTLLIVFSLILSSTQIQPSFAQNIINSDNVVLELRISPDHIEEGKSTHLIGYINLVNKNGILVKPSNDVNIKLKSDNTSIAQVPSEFILKANQDFSIFPITTSEKIGETTISATLNNLTVYHKVTVGESITEIPNDVELVMLLPSNEMHVESEMPFSVFLKSGDHVIQSPYDIPITLDYEKSLLNLNSDKLIIEKDNYYAWGTIKTSDKIGNAFLKASQSELNLNSAKSIKISSSFPSGLHINVFPEIVPKEVERYIDIVVSLVDSDGNPTLAQDDVPLKFFSDVDYVGQQIDKKMKESLNNGIIKKGEFSYYFKQKLTLNNVKPEINVGVSTPGLGIANDCFITRTPYTFDNPQAKDKVMHVFTVDKIPSSSSTIATYQIGALIPTAESESKENPCVDLSLYDGETDSSENGTSVEYHPVLSNEYLTSSGTSSKIDLISSNRLLLSIDDPGKIESGYSFGTAKIKSGKEIGQITLASTIKGLGSATTSSEIVNTLKHTKSMIFSPTGSGTLLFDKNGNFDLFLLSLDGKGRPTFVENEARYLLSPINELFEIKHDNTFAHATLHSDSFGASDLQDVTLVATPIGISANEDLKAIAKFSKIPTSEIKISTTFDEINANSATPYYGTVQLLDLNENPIKTTANIKVKIDSSDSELIQIPRFVDIQQGNSYQTFTITPKGKIGNGEVSANANGVIGSKYDFSTKSFLSKLSISTGAINEPITPGEALDIKIYVDNDQASPVDGAKLRIVPIANATITQTNVKTQTDGSAVVHLMANNGPMASFQIFATAEGYLDEQKTIQVTVQSNNAVTQEELQVLGLPEWAIYVGIAAIIIVVAVLVIFLKKPKQKLEEEDEIFEEDI